MAEIRSTLDIVLERTKNLTLTEQEKASLQEKELKGRIRGWVKKYVDGLMDLTAVKVEMAAIPKNRRKTGQGILRSLILEHLGERHEAGVLLDLLEGILEESREPYLAALHEHQQTLAAERQRQASSAKAMLARRGISGSAVSPNIDREESWKRFQDKALDEFRKSLTRMSRER